MEMDPIFKDGFFLKEVSDGFINNLASFSLHNSLMNFAKTASDLDYLYSQKLSFDTVDQKKNDENHRKDYAVDACNAIIQFQHFLELFLKDVLLEVGDLMVYDPSRKPLLLYKMIKGESIEDSEIENEKFIEFSDALTRVEVLIKNTKLDRRYNFLAKYFIIFRQINTLRNRIIHRGAFIIRHNALDKIFGIYILPFIKDLGNNVTEYSSSLTRWINIKDNYLSPFDLIIDEYKKTHPNELAVYLYKIMASAGYNNTLDYSVAEYFQCFLENKIKAAESIAGIIAEKEMNDIKECPICGCKTLIEHTDTEFDEDDKGNVIGSYSFVYCMKCNQCGFQINDWLGNGIKGMGLPIPDYFWVS